MAKEHPRYAQTDWPEWSYEEFPMMIYPTAPDPKKPYGADGKPLPGVIVNSAEEAAEVMGQAAPTEAPAPKVTGTISTGPGASRMKNDDDLHAELLAEAEQKGVTVDRKWSTGRLRAALDAAAEAVV